MKHLRKFLNEKLEPTHAENLKLVFKAKKDKLSFSVPETYSENDFQIYLNDRFLDDFPSGPDNANRFFGKNAENIDDAYFEYKSFTKMSLDAYNSEVDVEWDSKYDESKKDTKLSVYVVSKLSYTILIDDFELMSNNNGDDIDTLIEKVGNATESSELNKYPIDIVFSKEDTEYEKTNKLEK